jgi:hypothetical protein
MDLGRNFRFFFRAAQARVFLTPGRKRVFVRDSRRVGHCKSRKCGENRQGGEPGSAHKKSSATND